MRAFISDNLTRYIIISINDEDLSINNHYPGGWQLRGAPRNAEDGIKTRQDKFTSSERCCGDLIKARKPLGDDYRYYRMAEERRGAIEFSGLVIKLGIESWRSSGYAAESCHGICGDATGRG